MNRLKRRAVSLLLAAIMLLGLFPPATLTARAADESIKLTDCDFTGMSYHSEALGNASIHTMDFNYAGGMTGFCGDHGKKMGRSLIGQTWGNRTEITDPTVKMMLAYYYDHTLGKFTDAAVAKGVNNVWDDDYVYYMNAWIQAVIWLYKTGQLTNPVEDCAEELMWVFNCLKGENHSSIDECTAGSETSFRDTVQYIFTLGPETWGLADVYLYEFTGAGNENYPPDLVQSVVIGNVEHSSTPESYSLTVKKVDATNTSLGLPGAAFHIVKQGSTESWDVVTGSGGTYTLTNLSAGTYAITETSAPDGYTIDNAGPDYVVLPNNGETTVTKVFTDTPTVTVKGSIRKVDRDNPSKGLAGATIAIQGIDNSFYGEYQTGAGGALEGLTWSSLTPGTYRAWEVSAPEGYSLDPSDVKTFRISAETPEVSLVFKNDAKVKVRLVKLDASDSPLPGAVFNIFRDGQIIATEATDANGQITISDVETGMYAFVETFAPEGYAINDQPAIVHVSQADIEGGGVISVTAVDKRLPDLTIQKKDAATGEAVPNTVFELNGVRTGYHKEIVTGNDGTATLTGIPVDYYEVTEKNVPAPYVVSDEPTQTIWLGAGEHPTLVFSNLQEPKLSIMKIDAETSAPIAGVVFSVQGIDVDYSADWTTGADGKYEGQITPGSYRITETSVPAPYVVSANNVRTVSLTAGSERQLVFENLKNPLLNLTKIDALDGRTIPGTVFAVQGVDNSFSGNWTTGADGTVSERIEPGTYRITEVSVPAPYYLPENAADRVQTISLSAGDIRSLVFKDYRTPTLTIYKLDSVSGAPIEGAQFHVTYTRVSDIPDAPATYDFGTLYSNANGEIPLHETGVKLYPGRYTVTETAPAPGFQMREPTTQSVTINGSESRSVTFYNAPLNAIIVEKYDAQTGRALPGATFRLRYLGGTSGSGGTVIGIKTTGASGSAIWTGLEAGTYIVDEISAPEGYNILRSSETVYLSNNGTQSVVTVSFENSQNGGLLIRKIDAKTKLPMAGVEFLVTDSRGAFIGTGNGKFVTDADGSILIGDVTPGTTLIVRETRTLPGYILDTTPQTCVVQEGRTTTLEFRNEPDGIIIIYKKDAMTGAALGGVQFTVTNGSGELVAVADGMISSNGVYYTNNNGQITLDGLKPDTYVITETATISGYVIDRTPHTIAVKANDTQTLTLTNRPRGGLIIMKLSRQTRQPLAGAEFRIVPADAALFTDNEGLTSPNNLYVTDADGQISLSNLTPGAYIITETNAPEGYSLDSEAQTVTVRSGRTESVSFYDSELAILRILKRDAVSGQPLADAEFTVTTADGTRLGDNNGIFTTDSDGTVTVTDLQPNSAVIVAESSSPAGYVMDATPKSVIVRSGTVNSLVFDDEPKTTLIVHKYVSGTRNEPLAGVEFKVTDSKGEVRGMNNGVYYTDASGDFMVTGLDPGLTVTVRETKTVDGYILDGTPQNILIKAGERQELTFWNQRKGTLIVRKLDSVTGNPISGAEFHIAYANGNPVDANNGRISSAGRYVTDSRGEITLTDVTGTIVVTETKAADGYYISPENRSQTVIVNPEDAQTVTFFNTPTQTLILQKYVTDTTTPIQGVSFYITDSAGNAVGSSNGDFVTDRNGQITISGLIPGTTITARESAVPDDYVLDATPRSILIRTGEAQTLTVYNQLRANLIVEKIDSATGSPLAGAQFKITTANGAEIAGFSGSTANNGVFTTDRAGQITLNKLTPGAYVLTETKAPNGYVLNAQPQTILLGAGETKTVTVGNAVKGSLIIRKFDSVTRQPLAGAEFKVTTAEGTLVAANGGRTSSNGIYTTDANGQITLSGLQPGSYVVTESKAPDNYYLNVNSQTVVVTADDVQTLSFYDEPFVSLTILKRDSVTKAPLSGAEFSVKDAGGAVIANCATGADGTVTVSGLTPNASLVITETAAPAGYVLSETPQTVRVRSDAPNSVTFEDAPTGTLVIRKFIAGTANEPLSGVAFKVMYGNGKNVGTDDGVYYTDNAGEITLTGLTPGATVKAREIRTADGFVLDGTPQDIEIQPGQTQQLTFWNTRKGSLLVRKLDSVTGNPLSGVMFRITTATGEYVPNNDGHTSSNGFFTTDSAGEILLTGVTGTLVVTEFSTISGYVIDEATRSQTVVVSPDDTQTLVFYNEPMSTLTVQKYVTGTTTPLKGAKFFVSDSHGAALGNSNGMFTTDENGRFVISDLAPGLTVSVTETEAPDGYVLDSTPQTVRIRSGISAQTLTFYNAPKGSISVRKLDAVTEQPLSGAEFKVTSANGLPLDNDGGKISTNGLYRTDDNGQFLITKVQPGAYVITETKAPEGYILDATPLTITVGADDAQTITVKNRPKQTLTVQKFIAGTSTPLSGVEFLVTDNRGAVIGPSNGIYTTDDNGRFVVSGLTPGQTITVKETKTVSGYILNDKPQSITIEDGDAQTLTFYNEAKSALLIIKRDSVTEQPLKGAEFQVLTADGKFVDDMGGALSSNGIYTTDERGQILISGLNPGVLVVKETKAPDGYMLDDKPQTVELKVSETQTLTFRNIPKQTVIVQKYVEGTTNPLPGVTFLITDGGGNRIGAGEYVTDANGRIEIPGVNPGTTVIAREVKTASGYALNGSPKSLEVKVGTLNALTFYDEPLSTLILRKYIEGTANEPLPGVAFKVVDGSGANVGTGDGVYYTDSAGEIRIENLEAGTVIKAREIKTVGGFVLDGTPQDILIQSGVEQELVFWNKRQGTLTISKLDSVTRQPLSGVEFKVAYADGRAIGDGRYFTDSRGEINITGINGTVIVTETATIPGYVMDADGGTQTVAVNPMEGRTVTFTNTPMQTLTVRKLIQGTTTPIPGAVFMVSDSSGATLGNNNGEFTTDSNGEITVSGLIPGTTVTAREVRPASGYVLNGEAQTIKIKSGDAQTLTFYNVPQESLTIRKYAEGTTSPLSGVTFYVTDGAGTPVGSGEFVTGDNGTVTIPGFAPGDTVIVREVKTVKGYALNGTPKTLKIASGQENALTFYDAPLSVLLVHKYVDGTANEPLPGVTFKITNASGANVGDSDGIYVTDASGDIAIPDLEAGTVVKAREVKTVDGYLLDGTPQDIEITKAAVNELTFWNVPAQTLIIEKRASDTDAPLQGVTFTVRDSGGAFLGSDNGEFTTDRNGQIVIRGLVPGVTITAQEKKTVSGYVLDETPQSILIQKGNAQKLVFRNAPKGALTVRKLDAVTGQPLSGAEFRILTVSGNPVDDNEGQTSTNGVYTTDANGEIIIAKLQPGVYKVSESKAPDGYVLDTTVQTVTVNANDSQTLTFRDLPKQALTIQKYEKGTTTPLSGAKFLVTDDDAAPVGENNGEFVTDDNGRFVLTGLTPGVTVTAKEIEAPDGYVLDSAPKSIKIKSGAAQTLTFYNVPEQRLIVQKYVTNTTTTIPGVTFHIEDTDGKPLGNANGDFVTDANGQIVISGLTPGMSVTAKETKAVSGYVLDSAPQTIKIQSGDAQILTFFNAPKGSLTVRKLDIETDAPLSGAEFKVTDAKGNSVDQNEGQISTNGIYRTDDNGQFTIANIQPGAYIVTEIKAPEGYVLDNNSQTVTVNANDAQTLTFRDMPLQSVIIQKYIDGTTKPLAGVTFLVTDTNGAKIGAGEYVTDANGQIVLTGLTPGMSLVVREVKTVKGYVLNGSPQTIQVGTGNASLLNAHAAVIAAANATGNGLTFYDEPLSTLAIHKYVSGTDNQPLPGVTFKVVDGSGKNIGNSDGIYVTDDSGDIVITDLEPGTVVKVREIKTVDGYVLDGRPQDIQIQNSELHELTFWNAPKQSVVIRKFATDTTTPLAGVTFHVAYSDGETIGDFVTNHNGEILISGLVPGVTITAQEVKTVSGYVLDSTPQSVKIKSGEAQSLVFYNSPKGSLSVTKRDSLTDAPLSGAEFKVTDAKGKVVDQNEGQTSTNGVYVTDANGQFTITGLQPGAYVVTETKAPEGYVLDKTPQTVTVNADDAQTLTFRDVPKQRLTVQKYEKGTTTPISGAKFLVTDNGEPVGDSNGEFTTDDNGQFVLAGLTPGATITVKEIEAAEGYVLDGTPKSIKIKSGAAQSLTFYNVPTQSLVVQKYVKGTTTPIQGAKFLVTDDNETPVGENHGEFVTDENGRFVVSGLTPGVTITVEEIEAAEGYVLDNAPKSVKIKSGAAQTLTFYNLPTQNLIIRKYVTDSTTPIPGVTFRVTSADGKTVGASNGEFVTDNNGEILISGLAPGDVLTLTETKAASGYVLDSAPQTIKIQSGDAQSLVFYNSPKGSLTVRKLDAETDAPLSGAEFKVTTLKGEPVDRNEGQISTNGIYATDDNGQFTISALQPGAYVVTETKAPNGYALDNNSQTVTVNANDAQTLTFRDIPLQSLTIQKYIDGTTRPLSGVTFLVTDNNGNRIGNGEYVTDDNGQIVLNGLTPGMSLVVREIKTVKGYVLNGTPQTVQIGAGGANAVTLSAQATRGASNANGNSLTFYDEPLSTLVVHKYVKGTDNEPLPGVTFKIVDGSGKNVGNLDGLFVTDNNGDITIPDLEPGTVVKVREVKTVDGYVLDGTPQDIEIQNSELHELTFWNAPKQSLVIRIFVTDTTTPIPGATFHVTDSSGALIGDFTTDNNGEILISGLIPGVTVTAKETRSVSGYILDSTPQSVKIKSNETQTITFYNAPKGSLSVAKLDSLTERPLSGAEFRVMTAKGEFVDQNEGETSTNGVYRTDESGRFTISGLMPGSYVVTEIKAPDGYVLDSEPQTVTVNANDAQTLTFRDAPVQTLIVEVFITDTTTPIPGTAFIVTAQDGTPIGDANGEFIADENGRITIPGLTPGMSVTVTETKAANGYLPDGTPKTILIKSGDAQTLRFYNSPAQTLTVQMFVTGTTDPIPGVTFHITDSNGKVIGNENGDFVTDKGGKIVISGLIPGVSVTAKETKTVSGYVLDTTPQTIAIRSGDAQMLTFFNAPKGALVLRAVDAVTEETLPDVEFKIVSANGEPLDSNEGKTSSNGIYKTDDNGTVTLTKVQPGIYHIVETKVPDGYVLNEEPQTVTVNADDTQTIVFRIVPKQSLTIQVYEEGTTKPIPGIAFLLKDSGGAFIGPDNGEYTTDANGQITVSSLTPGVTVVAHEIRTVAGYVLNNVPQNIKIQTGDAQKLTFFNIPLESLTIWKFQKGTTNPLQGVAFHVVDGDGEPINGGEYVTDENGRIVIDGLEPGITVTAREIRTVKGYQLNGNPQNIKIASGKDNALTFYDDPLSTLIVRLYVDGTENEPISGAAFKVVDGSGKSLGPDDGVYYTDHAGMFTLENLEPGVTVKARLIKIADEFVLDGTPQDILMESGDVQSLTFWAQRAGSLTIRSLDSVTRQPIPNVEFKVTYADGRPVDTANGQQSSNGQYFTDANGEIRITGVIGTIIVTEEKAADNYTMDSANRSQTVIVRPADGQTLTFFDAPAQGLTVQLYVKGTTEPISGAKFLLTDGTGAKLGDENGEFTTDENGRFSLSGLKPGLTVKVKQISTLDAYIPDGASKTVTIKAESEQTVTVYNAPKQTLTVRLYVKGTETPIPGAKFLLRDSGGALVGENNGVFTTNDNGEFSITGLTPGVTITATQTDTISGYVLETAPQSILIKSGNAQSLVFYNAPKGALAVRKLNAVTEEPLAGAEFKILTISGTPVDDNEGKTSTKGVYKTDANGEITLLKLEPGVYEVTETKAPDGYVLDSEPQTVTVNANDRQTLTFRDSPLQSLTIRKYEDGTTKPLAGVTFTVTDTNGNRIGNGEYVTDANGEITITGLVPGTTVIVRETRTVKGYVLNGNPQTITIGNGANALTSGASAGNGTATRNALTFYDEPLSTLVIHKYVEGTDNEPLANVEFKITDGKGAKVGNGTYYTDKSGEIRVENLEPGMTVTVRETKAVSGYVLDGTPKTAEIPSGDVLEMEFWNPRQGTLVVRKQDAETKAPLGGVEFKVTYADGRPVDADNGQTSSAGQYFTDDNGEIRIAGIIGTIIVTEEKTVPGYVIDPNAKTKTVTVNPGDTQTLTFFNQKKQTLTVQKFVEGTKTPIPGVTFLITDSQGAVVGADNGEFVTDDNGRIVISDLTPGVTITAKETKAADGYALNDTPKSIAIKSGAAQSLTFYNAPLRSLVVTKYVKGTTKPISGAVFQITDADGVPVGNGEYVTDDNGQIVIPNLAPGVTVSVREVRSASGFVLNGTPQTVKIKAAGNNALTFYDEPLSTLVVHKYEEGTQNKPLSGVEFRITDGSGAAVGNGTFYTDKNGEIRVENLEPGMTVTVRESKTISGYVLDGTPQTVKISGDAKELVFWNAPQQTLTINKFVDGTNTPIKGVTFHVTDQTGAPVGDANGEFVTDNNGKIVISGLAPGVTITAKETKAADGYALDNTPKSILIKSGAAQSLNFYNKPTGTLIVMKRDRATEQPLKGATFQIMTADGKYVPNAGGQLSSNGLYVTDDKGQIIITGLSSDTIVVKETKAPDGYLLDDTPQTVKVGPNDTQTLTFYDDSKQTLTIQKFIEGTTKPIQGVTFLITDSNGKVVGSSNGEFQTDRNGRIVLTGLTPGTTITAKETRTVDGYVLDATPQSILIKEGEAQTLTYYNAPEGGLELIKVDASDKSIRIPNTTFEVRKLDGGLVKKITTDRNGRIHTDLDEGDYYLVELEAANGYKLDPTPEYFSVKDGKTTTVTVTNVPVSGILLHKTDASTGKGLYGVTFLLYDSKNNPIGQYTTDDKGYIRIENLDAGKYSMRELENKGYVPDTQLKTVYVKSGETTLIEWKNIPITAQIQITKKSADYNSTNGLPAGTPLEGAIFEIRDKASNIVDTVQSDKSGLAVTKPLPLGRYTIKETKAPAHYGVNENEWTAYLEHEGQIVRFEITDKSLITGVSITKTGPKQVMNGQPVIYRFSGIANTSNVRLDSFYWRDAIPAQVRLQTVVTGTYNFPGTYKITYRVNGSEPRTLADNLSTQRNYTLAASQTALGLKSNELVTEVMFVFGQAPAGFAQVEAPSLNCVAIPNILAYSFVNQADVGGVYNGQWVQGTSRWVTSVYKKPVKLPRTGY